MRIRRALISLSLAFIATTLHGRPVRAQETVRGHVVDHDGSALPQAEVQLVELNRKATTNRAGEVPEPLQGFRTESRAGHRYSDRPRAVAEYA